MNGATEPAAEESKVLEILADGTHVKVSFKPSLDGSGHVVAVREPETVKVWKLGIAEMPILGEAMADEAREIAVVTKKDSAWVALIDDDSFEALIEEGRRLNFTRFERYWKRRTDLLKAMGQSKVLDEAVSRALQKVVEGREAPISAR